MTAMAPLVEPPTRLAAVVQADAVGELPTGVEAIVRPVSSGTRRALDGLRPPGPAALVHGLDVDLPLVGRAPLVTTVHDLAVFDVPDAFARHRVLGERLLVRRAVRAADEVVAVSSFTAERIHHHFGRSASVIPLAPSPAPAPASPGDGGSTPPTSGEPAVELPERFVLQVATIEPRKDGQLLASACRKLGYPLVLAGGVDPRCRVPDGAIHLGRVPDATREALMDRATVVAYVSRYEGFGLPPLEAMARSRPVVATAVGALPDLVGQGALLVPVGDQGALERALRLLWEDDEANRVLARAGRQVADGLSWSATAASTLDIYRRLGVAV